MPLRVPTPAPLRRRRNWRRRRRLSDVEQDQPLPYPGRQTSVRQRGERVHPLGGRADHVCDDGDAEPRRGRRAWFLLLLLPAATVVGGVGGVGGVVVVSRRDPFEREHADAPSAAGDAVVAAEREPAYGIVSAFRRRISSIGGSSINSGRGRRRRRRGGRRLPQRQRELRRRRELLRVPFFSSCFLSLCWCCQRYEALSY